jgi:hypothetical protein
LIAGKKWSAEAGHLLATVSTLLRTSSAPVGLFARFQEALRLPRSAANWSKMVMVSSAVGVSTIANKGAAGDERHQRTETHLPPKHRLWSELGI